MVRSAFALMLVLSFVLTSSAVANNGSRKVTQLVEIDGNEFEQDVDGVGVVSFSPGNNETNFHVVVTGLNDQEPTTYQFIFALESCATILDLLDPLGDLTVVNSGLVTTNGGGNAQAKALPLSGDFLEFPHCLLIVRDGTIIAVGEIP